MKGPERVQTEELLRSCNLEARALINEWLTDPDEVPKTSKAIAEALFRAHERALAPYRQLRPVADWHDDDGTVLWWHLPVDDPPYVGSGPGANERKANGRPTECALLIQQGFLTHWTPIPQPEG
jgi:hypothetical protein